MLIKHVNFIHECQDLQFNDFEWQFYFFLTIHWNFFIFSKEILPEICVEEVAENIFGDIWPAIGLK